MIPINMDDQNRYGHRAGAYAYIVHACTSGEESQFVFKDQAMILTAQPPVLPFRLELLIPGKGEVPV